MEKRWFLVPPPSSRWCFWIMQNLVNFLDLWPYKFCLNLFLVEVTKPLSLHLYYYVVCNKLLWQLQKDTDQADKKTSNYSDLCMIDRIWNTNIMKKVMYFISAELTLFFAGAKILTNAGIQKVGRTGSGPTRT